jgi:hypothetical protein
MTFDDDPIDADANRHPAPRRQASGALRRHLGATAAAGAAMLLAACAHPFFDVGRTETALPLARAWVDGRQVQYVSTDASDAGMAAMMGINHVPRLADAITGPGRPSILERVYKFERDAQISVFQSAPSPAGAQNRDRAYSPLWRVVMVRWLRPAAARELRSEEEVLAAADRADVALDVTNIVINCPITRSADGLPLRGVR